MKQQDRQQDRQQDVKQDVSDIIGTLVVLCRGNFVIEAGRELHRLTEAVKDTGKKGKLVITLEVSPSGLSKGMVNQVEILPDISISKPKPKLGKSIFFITENNTLVRDDPDQMAMEFEQEKENADGRR